VTAPQKVLIVAGKLSYSFFFCDCFFTVGYVCGVTEFELISVEKQIAECPKKECRKGCGYGVKSRKRRLIKTRQSSVFLRNYSAEY
jgi:hypothetical protein